MPMDSCRAIVETDDGNSLKALCLNISMGGMCLLLEDEIESSKPGSVKLLFEQNGEALEFCARFSIAWTNKQRPEIPSKHAGIQFVGLDNTKRSVLTRIMVTRLMELEKNREEGITETVQREKDRNTNYSPPFQ